MPNIFDYLDWRGDVRLTADPFNDVDNLILAELTYTDFSGILADNDKQIPVSEVCSTYFATRSREEIRKSDTIHIRASLLMDGMVSGERFSGTMLSDYVDIVDTDRDMQMSAVTYHLSDGTAYISFRGTDNTVVGWKEDFIMSYLPETGGQRAAVQYLDRVAGRLDCPIRVGGHSKGGNFAVYAAAFCRPEVQERIIRVYTNDGPGFRHEVMESDEYRKILPKVVSIVPNESMIGMLLGSRTEDIVVKSSEKFMSQHDGMSWQVMRNSFITEEQSDISRVFEDAVGDWLSKIDDESRESFVNSLFTLIESTGSDTFREIKMNKLKALDNIITSVQGMPRSKQQEMLNIAGELLSSSGQTVKKAIEEYIRKRQDQLMNSPEDDQETRG